MQQLLLKTILLAALAVCTGLDLKYRKIPLFMPVLLAAGGVIYAAVTGDYADPARYMGLCAGLVFCVLSHLTRQAIGMGDALLFTVLGWYLGIYPLLLLLFFSFGLAAVFSAIVLLCRKGNLQTRLPFLPFLYLAFGGLCLL